MRLFVMALFLFLLLPKSGKEVPFPFHHVVLGCISRETMCLGCRDHEHITHEPQPVVIAIGTMGL